jgi:hypothetical protein
MSTAERQLMYHARRTFSRFVAALNRRDSYELELNDADRRVTAERKGTLSRRLAALQQEIDGYEAELTRIERRLQRFEMAA